MYHSESIERLFKQLNSSKSGLSTQEVAARRAKFGYNILKKEKKTSALQLFLSQFSSMLVIILVIATIISALIGHYLDAIMIFIILVLNSIFGFIQDYRAEKSIEALRKLTSLKSVVLRNGKEIQIDSKELIPGDILLLSEGDKVPADARIIELKNLESQEASLTGESVPVPKEITNLKQDTPLAERKNMVFSGTIITMGHCKALVTSTGMQSELGKIAHIIQTVEKEKTPLQLRLQKLGKYIGLATLGICSIIFLITLTFNSLIDSLLTSISLAVAAIPEGLPAVVTIALALGLQRLAKKNALIRRLPAVETLGSTDVICTDKTGTLTRNEMTVTQIYCNNKIINVTGKGYETKGSLLYNKKAVEIKDSLERLLEIGALCNNSKLTCSEEKVCGVIGDPTESALTVAAKKSGINETKLCKKYQRIDEIPFSSERKVMTTIHKHKNKKLAFSKFAVEKIPLLCSKIQIGNKIRKITKEDIKKINKINNQMASNALRVLAFAYKEYKTGKAEENLIFVGLQAMMDPPREEIKESIKTCNEAGIKVIMITGDHKDTAVAIANQIGLKGGVIEGKELEDIDQEKLRKLVETTSIYARVNPEHKLRIVNALKDNNHIVAMTGDGINDAPALKKSDIGIAMGITGTDVAKEASEMVLTDDNFATIVNAIKEGRTIYENIKKFVSYLLSSNLAEILVIFIASIFFLPLPLLALQLLWINLVTDGLPALALSVDSPSSSIMKKKPRPKNEPLLTKDLISLLVMLGFVTALLTLGWYRWKANVGLAEARTMAFTCIVFFEIAKLQIIRSNYGTKIFSNKWLNLAVLSSIGLQLLVVYTPINQFFKTTPLPWLDISYILMTVILIIVINYLLKNGLNLIQRIKSVRLKG